MLASIVVESYRVTHLLPHCTWSLERYSVGHTHCGHSTRLRNYHLYFINRFHCPFCVLLNFVLMAPDWLEYYFRVHHVLRQLCGFTWTCVTCHDTKVTFWHCFLNLFFVIMNWQFLPEFYYLLSLHFLNWANGDVISLKIYKLWL